jgi:hypothetical protein
MLLLGCGLTCFLKQNQTKMSLTSKDPVTTYQLPLPVENLPYQNIKITARNIQYYGFPTKFFGVANKMGNLGGQAQITGLNGSWLDLVVD